MKITHPTDTARRVNAALSLFCLAVCSVLCLTGCAQRKQSIQFTGTNCPPCQTMLHQIEYPNLDCPEGTDGTELLAPSPITITNYQETEPLELTVEQCVEMALANSKVMQKLGGVVVSSPQGATTLYDPAILETGRSGPEAALSAFDAQLNSSFFYNRDERQFNNGFVGGGATSLVSNTSAFRFEVAKQTASGARFAARNLTDYRRTDPQTGLFSSYYDMVNQMEVRQPLALGRGTEINRIAGPNATPGIYNGVLIGRIRTDISLADFEIAVRNLVRDVENNYWELYYAYRDLDTKIAARDASRAIWENRKSRLEIDRPDDESQAKQQYFSFQSQAQSALTGILNGQPGVLGSERNLRRLMGLPTNDGTLIRPISDPTVAPVAFDWEYAQNTALERRVELRRQKWALRQRELELVAAKALNRWRVDLVGQYGFRGFGDNLFGSNSAFGNLMGGNLDDWQLGMEVNGALGNRQGHLAVRNAELNLVRERTLLKEQQRQILHDLNAAYTEVDRALAVLRSNFNSRVAVGEEVRLKKLRVDEGDETVFFLLDAQTRLATAESSIHRAIADYNKALLNFDFVAGRMLNRYNIQLTEGPWSDAAQQDMYRDAGRYGNQPIRGKQQDVTPLSGGPVDQTMQPPLAVLADQVAPGEPE